MTFEEIIRFLKSEIRPLNDEFAGPGYRASAQLKDGTYLPAVVFRNPNFKVELAIRRFDEEKKGKGIIRWGKDKDPYKEIVKRFVTGGNRINDYDIEKVDFSINAFPQSILSQIQGETKMGWTGFVARMNDNSIHAFGTTFHFQFFQLPKGYKATDIKEIINHSYLSPEGEIKSYRNSEHGTDDFDISKIYKSISPFECFIENL